MVKVNLNEHIGKKINKLTILRIVKRDVNPEIPESRKRRNLYECECDCGNITIIWPAKLLKGKTKSCGCYTIENFIKRNKSKKLHDGESAKRSLIRSYKSNARNKGYTFNLTDDECTFLFKQNCHYCNAVPRLRKRHSSQSSGYLANGIDRMDNNIGYEIDNVITCCSECNYKKGAQSFTDFTNWINRLVQNANK